MSNGCGAAIAEPVTTDVSFPDMANFTARVKSTKDDQFPKFASALEDIDAKSRITDYLSLQGTQQRAERESLVRWFRTSRGPERHIESLLKLINEGVSEPRLEAAIDLLARLGSAVVNRAIQSAASPRREHSPAAYALAIAAGRIENSLILTFVRSPNDAFREAVIDLVDDLPADEGLPFLRQLASDSHPSIRRLATLALRD